MSRAGKPLQQAGLFCYRFFYSFYLVLLTNPVALILKSQLALKCTSVYACEKSPDTCLKGELVSFCRVRNAFHRLSTYATVIPAQMALDGGRSQLKHLRGHGSPRKLK